MQKALPLLTFIALSIFFFSIQGQNNLFAQSAPYPSVNTQTENNEENSEKEKKGIKEYFEDLFRYFEDEATSFEPGVGVFLLILAACLVLVGIGAVVALSLLAVTGFLVLLAVLTISLVVGVARNRPWAAMQALTVQVAAVAATLCALAIFWPLSLSGSETPDFTMIAIKSVLWGLPIGVLIALFFNIACSRMYQLVKKTYGPETTSLPRAQAPAPRRAGTTKP